MQKDVGKIDVVLIHGWGLNSGIWRGFVTRAESLGMRFKFHLIDLPGYGKSHRLKASKSLEDMALHCLDGAPKSAIWVGWSLGGLAALKALELAGPQRIKALQLIGTMPKFVSSEDWVDGVDTGVFQRFADELKLDYQRAMALFLQIQLLRVSGGRHLISQAMQWIANYPDPNADTLQAGIDCLESADLRQGAKQIGMNAEIPIQIISGSLDRVANPQGVSLLANYLEAELIEMHTGHAAFLAEPDLVLQHLQDLICKSDV